jgi:hypothetical protein
MDEGADSLFTRTVEADETYVGGRYDKRRKRAKYDKEVVFGMVERVRVHAKHVPEATRGSVTRESDAAVGDGARFMTDESAWTATFQSFRSDIITATTNRFS